jgi:hypothetical protein
MIETLSPNRPKLHFGQGLLDGDLQTLRYNLVNMHNLTPKIRGDTTLKDS